MSGVYYLRSAQNGVINAKEVIRDGNERAMGTYGQVVR